MAVIIGAETRSDRSQAGEVEKVVEACRPKTVGDNIYHLEHHVGEDPTRSAAPADAAVSNLDVLATTSAPATSSDLRHVYGLD